MRTDIRYTTSDGSKYMEFGGADKSLHYMEHELRDWMWSYTSGKNSSRITSFRRRDHKPKTIKFPVGIAAESDEEGLELRNKIIELGEKDILNRTPGTLTVGSWGIRCYIIGGAPTNYWLSDKFAEFVLTLLVEDPTWFKATMLYFEHETAGAVAGVKPDFPRDFPFDLVQGKPAKSFTNPSKSASPWLWRVYGPATNPYIRIGDNLHKVNTTIAAGAYLEVDSQSKTAVVVQDNGTRENVYKFRERGAHGSGSYLFEPIKPGTDDITWDNTFDFDLTLYETRSTPPYEKEQPQGEIRTPRAVSTQSVPSEVSA